MVTRYIANPEVVLREEDEDGGLLFNADTSQVRVLNSTGLLIFQLCDGNRTILEIVQELKKSFDNVPEVAFEQVSKFINSMVQMQFVGTVET